MMCRETILVTSLSLCFSLKLSASGNKQSSIAVQSTPELKLFVYGFPGLSSPVVQAAETEAASILRGVPIQLHWIDCTSHVLAVPCQLPQAPTDLIIHFWPKAPPQTKATTMGIAGLPGDYATAFIFYDRIVALRSDSRGLSSMLGRVLAHEITHLLIPEEKHTNFGLMRGQWSMDDLSLTSPACRGLPARSVQLMHREALRRMGSARSTLSK
jgi:hypothetical protein